MGSSLGSAGVSPAASAQREQGVRRVFRKGPVAPEGARGRRDACGPSEERALIDT
jgi:hypothetical protein